MAIRVTIWNENIHEKNLPAMQEVYPLGIHGTLAAALGACPDFEVRTATMDQPDCGLPPEVLDQTDVLLWWSHAAHMEVPDEVGRRVADRVLAGMGFIPLHSAHYCKPFRNLMGTSCSLRWRDQDYERLWCVNPGHPIAQGLPAQIELGDEEMYGEFFDIPQPDEVVFVGWFRGGEVFRSGCCWRRGAGKIFYFQPGHETFRAFHHPYVLKILENAIHWAAPTQWRSTLGCLHTYETTDELARTGGDIPQY